MQWRRPKRASGERGLLILVNGFCCLAKASPSQQPNNLLGCLKTAVSPACSSKSVPRIKHPAVQGAQPLASKPGDRRQVPKQYPQHATYIGLVEKVTVLTANMSPSRRCACEQLRFRASKARAVSSSSSPQALCQSLLMAAVQEITWAPGPRKPRGWFLGIGVP